MRKTIIIGAAVAASLAAAGTAQADTNVSALTGDWSVSNPSVTKVGDGVQFGPYADGGAAGGSLLYTGGSDLKLKDVNNFSFTFSYNQFENWSGAVPYGRIWLDKDADGNADATVMFDPSKGGGFGTLSQGIDHSFGTSDQSVRYDDDKGNSGQLSWDQVKAAHPNEDVIQVGVTAGWTGSTNVSAMVKKLTFNGETFNFVKSPVDGTNGAPGKDGTSGVSGTNGANGTNGVNGTTTIMHQHGKLTGATMRTLRARSIKGQKFVGVRASLRGKRLHTHGRTIKVDLRGKAVGNYNVILVAKYKTKRGKVHTVHSVRPLSITRS